MMENIPIFASSNKSEQRVKSSEFHRLVQLNGWNEVRQAGSHIIYEKNGKKVAVPYHGSKEIGKGLVQKLKKEMGL